MIFFSLELRRNIWSLLNKKFLAMLSIFTGIIVRSSQSSRSSRSYCLQRKNSRCFNASAIFNQGFNEGNAKSISADRSDATSSTRSATNPIRLSKLLSHEATNLTLSRRQAERLIRDGEVTLAGKVVQSPQSILDFDEIMSRSTNNNPLIKISGKPVLFNPKSISKSRDEHKEHSFPLPQIWAVHKLKGEVVTEIDPHGRPSLLERLKRSGVGSMKQAGKRKRRQLHLKPIGRLDIPSEGLILVTNDGDFARQMELPSSKIHREYRVRVHGRLSQYKIDRIRKGGIQYDNFRYPPMKVAIERTRTSKSTSSNTWLRGMYNNAKFLIEKQNIFAERRKME